MLSRLHLPRPEERRTVFFGFGLLFGMLAGHTLLETARDALFLAELPVTHLPWVYMGIAVLSIFLVPGRGRTSRRLSPDRALAWTLVVSALFTTGLWMLTQVWTEPWTYYVIYVWSGIFGTVALVQFWLVMGEVHTVTQAKRLFGLIGSGSILGAIFGAGTAWLLVAIFPVQHLLLAAAVCFALSGMACAGLGMRKGETTLPSRIEIGHLGEAFALLRDQTYLRLLLRLILLATVAVTVADYLFKALVDASIENSELGAFFAKLYAALNVIALVTQVALVGWILRVCGVHRAQWVLPILLMATSGWLVAGGGLIAAMALKGADGSLRHSLHRTATELLYLPISDSQRKFFKPIIDVIGQRGGQALASVAILVYVATGLDARWLGIALVVVAGAWVVTALKLEKPYFDIFRKNLGSSARESREHTAELDLGSLEAIFAALNSQEDSDVLAALELLAEQRRVRLIPALILYHPSRAIVTRALDLFVADGRKDFVPVAARLLEHPDAEIRSAALRARQAVSPDADLLAEATSDPSALVRATALVGLVKDRTIPEEHQQMLAAIIESGSPEERLALAQAIRENPRPAFADVLLQLASLGDVALARVLTSAMGAVRDPRFLPVLSGMLARRELRGGSRQALLAYGDQALDFLARALSEETLPLSERRHLPRTISRFDPTRAAEILLGRLLEEPDPVVRFKILRGLGRMRTDNPRLVLDRALLGKVIEGRIAEIKQYLTWRVSLIDGADENPVRLTRGHELLVAMLKDKERHSMERVFRLLGLLQGGRDLERIWRGLHAPDANLRAASYELFGGIVTPPWREPLMALLSESPDKDRLELAGLSRQPMPYSAVLEAMLEQPSEFVRAFAAYHCGELGAEDFKPQLERARKTAPRHVTRVVEQALDMLSPRRRRASAAPGDTSG